MRKGQLRTEGQPWAGARPTSVPEGWFWSPARNRCGNGLCCGTGAWAQHVLSGAPSISKKQFQRHRGRMSISEINLGNYLRTNILAGGGEAFHFGLSFWLILPATTEMPSEGLATAALEAGYSDVIREGGQAGRGGPAGHPWLPGPGTPYFTEAPGRVENHHQALRPAPLACIPAQHSFGCVWPLVSSSIKWAEAPPAGLW